MPCLVDARRLGGRADEHAEEQIGQRRMMLPISLGSFNRSGGEERRRLGGPVPRRRHMTAEPLVPVWRPSTQRNDWAPSGAPGALDTGRRLLDPPRRQLCGAGARRLLITLGSGATRRLRRGRRAAHNLEHHRQPHFLGGRLDRWYQFQIIFEFDAAGRRRARRRALRSTSWCAPCRTLVLLVLHGPARARRPRRRRPKLEAVELDPDPARRCRDTVLVQMRGSDSGDRQSQAKRESPGVRNRCGRRNGQRSLIQPHACAAALWIAAAKPRAAFSP